MKNIWIIIYKKKKINKTYIYIPTVPVSYFSKNYRTFVPYDTRILKLNRASYQTSRKKKKKKDCIQLGTEHVNCEQKTNLKQNKTKIK